MYGFGLDNIGTVLSAGHVTKGRREPPATLRRPDLQVVSCFTVEAAGYRSVLSKPASSGASSDNRGDSPAEVGTTRQGSG